MPASSSSSESPQDLSNLDGGALSGKSVEELEERAARTDNSAVTWQTWETLRELAVGRMRDDSQDMETRLRWVRLGLEACRRKGESSDFAPAKLLADEVVIKAYAIREFGAVRDDSIRDPVSLCETVFQCIGKSPEGVAAESTDWRSLPAQKMLRLRYTKNLLTPLRYIMDVFAEDDPLRPQLSAWLSLIPRLP